MQAKRYLAATAVAALATLTIAPAAEAATITRHAFVYKGVSPDSGTPGGAQGSTVKFTTDGVKIVVPTSQDFAYGVFAAKKERLRNVRNIGWDFEGTGDVAQYYSIDSNGDGHEDGDFTGERAYGGQDVWLQSGATPGMKRAAPSCDGSDEVANSPMDTASSNQLIAEGHCTGGSGSAWHGNLAQWGARLPNAVVLQSGFQVFDGQPVNGVLHSMNVGTNVYVLKK